MEEMPRVDAIWESAVFQREYQRLAALEEDRVFCRHGLPHLLDTARIMWALNLERACGVDREVVYAAALLHDVGKATQYASGEPHEVAGERLAREILEGLPAACAFSPEEVGAICAAIRAHRRFDPDAAPLSQLLYQADKASRTCFACPADVRAACSWSDAKKNLSIRV
ncbi:MULTISPECIES: HD domain-containing protein [Enorma]|uniref:HD domain-containing protein n=1 Tax=Enorma TaxID=1472762 RepID=UPI000346FD49|nr:MULTISPECIES: HD domain-containing protein [Enorma]